MKRNNPTQGTLPRVLFLSFATLVAAAVASGEVVYREMFGGSALTPLAGKAPDIRSGTHGSSTSAVWIGPDHTGTSKMFADGSMVIPQVGISGAGAFLPFTPQSGFVYTLSFSGVAMTSGDWAGLGFSAATPPGANTRFLDSRPYFWALVRNINRANVVDQSFAGERTGGGGGVYTQKSSSSITIVLDTTNPASWVVKWFLNDALVRTSTFTSSTAPAIPAITHVGFGYNTADVAGTAGTSRITDFKLEAIAPGEDSDSDGLPDVWEAQYFRASPSETIAQIIVKYNGSANPDGDSASNLAEYIGGSDPTNVLSTPQDTDADGLIDEWELLYFGNLTQTGSGDFDGDLVTNLQEKTANTNPANAASWPDTDSDGLNDAWEILYFGAVNHASALPGLNPDGDAFTNLQESNGLSNPTSPSSVPGDIDGDGLGDSWEIQYFANLTHGAAEDFDNDLNSNLAEFLAGKDPTLATEFPDADGDLLNDGWEILYFGNITAQNDFGDPDGDGYDNYNEQFQGTNPVLQFSSFDQDTDGLPDGWEIHFFALPGENPTSDRATIISRQNSTDNPDLDAYTNVAEFTAGSDPTVAASVPDDTDGDGLPDSWETFYFGNLGQAPSGNFDSDAATNLAELQAGSDPTSNTSFPGQPGLFTPYTPDGNTLHLWHFSTVATPIVDAVTSGGVNLTALRNSATLWQASVSGLGTALDTAPRRGTTTGAYLAPTEIVNPATTDNVPITLAGADGAFTYDAVVRIDFDPSVVQTTAIASEPMQILSMEDDTAAGRVFQFRIVPRGTLNVGAAPTLEFVNLHAEVGVQTITAPLPLTGAEALVQGAWYHVAVTYNGADATSGNLKLYWTRMDNTRTAATELLSAQLTADLVTTTGVFCVGNEGRAGAAGVGGTAANFVGLIDEVRISSIARASTGFYFTNSAPPASPTSLIATAGNATVGLGWSSVSGANTYTIKRSTVSGTGYAPISAGAVSGTTYSDTTVTNGTTYYYVVTAVGSGGESGNSNEASATPLSALASWRQTHFGSPANSGNGADAADADGDGLANLVEYALGTLPMTVNSSPLVLGRSGEFLTLTFNHIADTSLTYTIEASTDLAGAWGTAQTYPAFGSAGTTVFTDAVAISANPRRFLRLKVTAAP